MKPRSDRAQEIEDLRIRAEEVLKDREKGDLPRISVEGLAHLVHEQQTYQIELELQNEELRRAQIEIEKNSARYTDLYDFAPVGYVTVSAKGVILEANLTVASMVGVDRVHMIEKPLSDFIVKEDQDVYYLAHRKHLNIKARQTCEARMRQKDGDPFWVEMEGVVTGGADKDLDRDDVQIRYAIIDITDRKKAEKRRITHQYQLRRLSSILSLAEERERRRIAVELHDGLGQSLAMINIKLGALHASEAATDPAGPVQEVRELVKHAIQRIRSLTMELSSPILYDLGLEAALEWLTENFKQTHGLRCVFVCERRRVLSLSNDLRALLFSATRELLLNVVKHAQAKTANVSVRCDNHTIRISVADDGVGFVYNPHVTLTDHGFGLFSIHERLIHLGGGMEVDTKPGQGARITLVLPLEKKEGETNGNQSSNSR